MEFGASQYINNERQRSAQDIFSVLVDRIDQIDNCADNGALRSLIEQNRELEVSGNYQLARIAELKTKLKNYCQGSMTVVQNFELCKSYYDFKERVNDMIMFDQQVGNIGERKTEKISREMYKYHTKNIGHKKRVSLGMDPWSGRYIYTLEFEGEANIKTFDDCVVALYTVQGCDFFETTKKLMEKCEEAGCTRSQLADVIHSMVVKELPRLASSIKRRSTDPNIMLNALFELYTQDDTVSKIEIALEKEKREPRQDIALFGARVKELLIHKLVLTQPNLSEDKRIATACRITKQYCLDVVLESVKKQLIAIMDKKNREGREFQYPEFISCIQTLEEANFGEHKPTSTMYVRKGIGHERTALQHTARSTRSGDLVDLTIEYDKEEKEMRRQSEKKDRKGRSRKDNRSRSGNRPSRHSSRGKSQDSSRGSSRSSSYQSRASSTNSFIRSSRDSSRSSRNSSKSSRGSSYNRASSRSVSKDRKSQERESNFNTDIRRRSNKPNKENYNKDRNNKTKDRRDSKSEDRSSKAKRRESKSDTRKDKERSGDRKKQKLCVTCLAFDTCPVGKCQKYPKDIDWKTECSRCKRGCHNPDHCSASKN